MRMKVGVDALRCAVVMLVLGVGLSFHAAGCGGSRGDVQDLSVDGLTGTVEGGVTDAVSGAFLASATVILESGTTVRTTLTDGRGLFRVEGLAAGDWVLTAGMAGHTSRTMGVRVLQGQLVSVTMALAPTADRGALVGRVYRHAAGAPATVPLTGVEVVAREAAQTTYTDPVGLFIFSSLPAGMNTLELSLAGYRDAEASVEILPGGTLSLVFELLDEAGSLGGTVVETPGGLPLSGVLVSLPTQGLTTVTALDGTWYLDRVTGGDVAVSFQAASHDPLLVTTYVPVGGAATLDVTLAFGFGTVMGTVIDTLGAPIADALVSVPTSGLTTRTNGFGEYQFFEEVRTGTFVAVGSEATGFVTTGTWIALAPGDIVVVDFAMVPSVGDLTGTVVSAISAAPIPSAVCTIPYLGVSVVTNSSGAFFFDDLAPGVYPVQVSALGYTTQTTAAPVLAGTVNVTDVALVPVP